LSDFYLIGKILSLYGKEGYVKVAPFTDFPESFSERKKVYLDFFGFKKEFLIESVMEVKDLFVLKFRNFNSDDESEYLLGKEIFVTENDLAQLKKNEFFIHDLIDSKVIQSGEEIGKIIDVLSLPGNDLYVVKSLGRGNILIPAVLENIESFNPEEKILRIKPGIDLFYEDEN
jgi:16S rRNA processing protein RimM